MTKVIAVDLGGTHLRVSLVKKNRIIKYLKKKTPKNQKELLALLVETIEEIKTKRIKGIGIASPGPLKNGIIKNPPNLPLRNFDLKKYLEKKFKTKVIISNDASCIATAEARLGVKKKNFIILTLGTGIGGGIIINRKIYTGTGYAGEFGSIILDDGRTMEKLWQENRKTCKKCFGKDILIKDLLKIKDKKAKQLLDETSKILGIGISSLIDVFDPEVVVIAGGVRETGNLFLNKIKEQVKKYSLLPKTTPISWSKLDHPGTLGASLLIK